MTRGLTTVMATWSLQERIWLRALKLVNRFRVIRTIDIAVHCFAERPFKAALSAAQRAVRGMVKAKLLTRYRTDRFMTVYALTQAGADWLQERGVDAAASTRRVTDMTNPEHRLWSQFLTLCAEARGLQAMTEAELLQHLYQKHADRSLVPQGLLQVNARVKDHRVTQALRPDAIAIEHDGLTWYEVDRSARGAGRAASLRALALSVGATTHLDLPLRRVVIYCRTERILHRVLATLAGLAQDSTRHALQQGRRRLEPTGDGSYGVWMAAEHQLADKRSVLKETLAGHVQALLLPTWLPKVRLDGRGGFSPRGWFHDNCLPHPRLNGPWPAPGSPLLKG